MRGVIAIVTYEDKILLGKKIASDNYLSEKWHIPGEKLKEGETDEDALRRGMMEEAGLDIVVNKYLAKHLTKENIEVNWYECTAITNEIIPGSDLTEADWIKKDQVKEYCSDKAINLWPKEIHEYFSKHL